MKFLRIAFLIIKELICLPLTVLASIFGAFFATLVAIVYRDTFCYAVMWYTVKDTVIWYIDWAKDFANTGKW
jgi:prepilin signal peptidase PulO-like enzyme (type II secretory pathway)